jgi:hypothetical protein
MFRNILAAAIVIGALAAVASAGAGERARCSIMPFVGVRPSQTTVLLGTASPDTVEAGPGSVTSSDHGGHFGRGGTGAIYGQVVDVARFGGTDSLALARVFALHGRARVVIVPWDYDGSCAPTRWSEGAAWVPIAEPGAFTVILRPDYDGMEGQSGSGSAHESVCSGLRAPPLRAAGVRGMVTAPTCRAGSRDTGALHDRRGHRRP